MTDMIRNLKAVLGGSCRWLSAMSVAVLIMAGLSSCGGDDSNTQSGEPRPMKMNAADVTVTKTPATTLSSIDTIGVYGYYTKTERWIWSLYNQPDSLLPNRFCNLKLTKSKGWSYSPIQYWPIDARNKISLFAYAPYMDSIGYNAMQVPRTGYFMPSPLVDSLPAIPTINMMVDTVITKQFDLLWAAAKDKSWQDNGGVVGFQMKHALAGVKFSAVLKDATELAKGYTVRVTVVGLFDVHGVGTMRLDTGEWTFDDSEGNYMGQYIMKVPKAGAQAYDGRLQSVDISGRNFNPLATGDLLPKYVLNEANSAVGDFLMVMPQNIANNPSAMLTFVLEFKKPGTDTLEVPWIVMLSQVTDENGQVRNWKAGEVVEYRLIITDEFVTIHTMAHPWKDTSITADVLL